MPTEDDFKALRDPVKFAKVFWPHVNFFKEQREILYSVEENDETFVPAANMVGKDFVAGFVVLKFFLTHREVRTVTTSVKDDHLRVLWGEIGRYIQSSRYPLTVDGGGPLIWNHRDIRKVRRDLITGEPKRCEISYLRGMVSERGEGMAGHHAEHTFCVIDEASGVSNLVYTQQATWARKLLAFGNCNEPIDGHEHFFYKGCKAGDLVAS